MNTVNIDGIELFNSMYPNFFESVKKLPEDAVYEEMLLPLGDRNFTYKKDFGEDSLCAGIATFSGTASSVPSAGITGL